MSDRIFLDANVLIYAHDIDAGTKNRVAAELVRYELARKLDRSEHRLNRLLSGRAIPRPGELERISAAVRVRRKSSAEIESRAA